MGDLRYFRSVLAMAVGLMLGGALNLFLLQGSATLLSSPIGGVNDWLTYADLLEPQHFAVLFVAHALSTFVGALTAYLIAVRFRVHIAYAIGVILLFTDVVTGSSSGAPAEFVVLNLLGAYLPVSWLAIKTGQRMEGVVRTPVAAKA